MNYLSGIQVSLLHLLSENVESFIAVHVFSCKSFNGICGGQAPCNGFLFQPLKRRI